MNGAVLSYIAGFLLLGWGVVHLVPTRAVVRDFGEISPDNKRIITMEWITEGVALVFIGGVIAAATYLGRSSSLSKAVYWLSFFTLNVLSVVSLFTGFRNRFIAFKLCPFIFSSASVLILIGSYLD
jgi:hypothetical protein